MDVEVRFGRGSSGGVGLSAPGRRFRARAKPEEPEEDAGSSLSQLD